MEGDILVASINCHTDVITSLAGQNSTEYGIAKGYASGNLGYVADWWNGVANDGEFTVTGTSFTPNKLVVARKYYTVGGSRVAMRQAGTLFYLLSDHLGGTNVTVTTAGVEYGEVRYKAFGDQRYASGTTPTTMRYTGQRQESYINLYWYGSRWYDPALGRFVQPDSIIPDPNNPLDWDRFAYTGNNPVRYVDPTGHWYYDPGCDCLVATKESYNEYPENLDYEDISDPFDFSDVPVDQIGEFDPVMQFILSWMFPGLELGFLYDSCQAGDCSWFEIVLTLAPLLPDGIGKAVVDIIPTGQWHHVISNKIGKALGTHLTLSGIFDRGIIVVQALDKQAHQGYQTWHRLYDSEVVKWLKTNGEATPEEFVQMLIEVYQRSDMAQRFPGASQLLQMLLEELK